MRRRIPGGRQRRAWPVAGLVTALVVAACTTVPITGRRQLNFIPDSQMLALSFQQYAEFLRGQHESDDAKASAMVRRVGRRIADAVERYLREHGRGDQVAGYAWEFHLIESDEVNAWAMPGGKVVVYTGLLPLCRDDTGLAVVLGHEVAHAVARHGAERMSQALLAELGGAVLDEALRDRPEETRRAWMSAYAVGATYGALLPFSRTQESEADRLGLVFMAMAGYDPRAAVDFWTRMARAGGGQAPPEFMSTHPSDARRIRDIRAHLGEALRYYAPR